MNKVYFQRFELQYCKTSVHLLPLPVSSIPLTANDYDYKTYYVFRVNQVFEFLEQ
jgi:hypothetical protein